MDCAAGGIFQPLPPNWRQGLFGLYRGIASEEAYSYSDQLGSEVRAVQVSEPLTV